MAWGDRVSLNNRLFVENSSVTSHIGETSHSRDSDAREKLGGKTSRVSFECRECEFTLPSHSLSVKCHVNTTVHSKYVTVYLSFVFFFYSIGEMPYLLKNMILRSVELIFLVDNT